MRNLTLHSKEFLLLKEYSERPDKTLIRKLCESEETMHSNKSKINKTETSLDKRAFHCQSTD